jgi:hypothetical protein
MKPSQEAERPALLRLLQTRLHTIVTDPIPPHSRSPALFLSPLAAYFVRDQSQLYSQAVRSITSACVNDANFFLLFMIIQKLTQMPSSQSPEIVDLLSRLFGLLGDSLLHFSSLFLSACDNLERSDSSFLDKCKCYSFFVTVCHKTVLHCPVIRPGPGRLFRAIFRDCPIEVSRVPLALYFVRSLRFVGVREVSWPPKDFRPMLADISAGITRLRSSMGQSRLFLYIDAHPQFVGRSVATEQN